MTTIEKLRTMAGALVFAYKKQDLLEAAAELEALQKSERDLQSKLEITANRVRLLEENKAVFKVANERLRAENAELRETLQAELDKYEAMIAHGKGTWPETNYVKDEEWARWHEGRTLLRSILALAQPK